MANNTLAWYAAKLRPMLAALGDDLFVDAVSGVMIRSFVAGLYERDYRLVGDQRSPTRKPGKLSPEYIRGIIRAMRVFWAWAALEYGIMSPLL